MGEVQEKEIDVNAFFEEQAGEILDVGEPGEVDEKTQDQVDPEDAVEPESEEESSDEQVESKDDQGSNDDEVGEEESVDSDDPAGLPGALTDDGFISQGEEGPELYMGEDDKGAEIYQSADEVFGDTTFKIKAAGADHEVTFAEMRKGYQRQADYTQGKMQIAEAERQIGPYTALVSLFSKDADLRTLVQDYVEGAKTSVTETDIDAAIEDGDTDKIKSLIKRKKSLDQRRARIAAAEQVQKNQDQQIRQQNRQLAANIIPDYNNSISRTRDYLLKEGFDENQLSDVEHLPPLVQKVFYTAALASGATSADGKPPKGASKKALRGRRRQIVRRPPKGATPGTGRSPSKTSSTRRQKAAFKKAYDSGSVHDLSRAFESVISDDDF